MTVPTLHETPSASVIRSLLQHTHELSIYSRNMPYALKAEVIELNLGNGRMVLEVEYAGADIERYLTCDSLSFDLEALNLNS
ncbi:hypothetical protein [Halomonas sp. hl-4]|uniref:hypothetical protein n=1 Tax=Halomonas sp. hl-4 TaxID=1761789 RepID=UPI000BB8D476|nr:hypothetical protein [Halomonas sp. hl-4]SNY97717.1 hypothetical protein SAMN04488142_2322 [Halomonas sp. hl-4]